MLITKLLHHCFSNEPFHFWECKDADMLHIIHLASRSSLMKTAHLISFFVSLSLSLSQLWYLPAAAPTTVETSSYGTGKTPPLHRHISSIWNSFLLITVFERRRTFSEGRCTSTRVHNPVISSHYSILTYNGLTFAGGSKPICINSWLRGFLDSYYRTILRSVSFCLSIICLFCIAPASGLASDE